MGHVRILRETEAPRKSVREDGGMGQRDLIREGQEVDGKGEGGFSLCGHSLAKTTTAGSDGGNVPRRMDAKAEESLGVNNHGGKQGRTCTRQDDEAAVQGERGGLHSYREASPAERPAGGGTRYK